MLGPSGARYTNSPKIGIYSENKELDCELRINELGILNIKTSENRHQEEPVIKDFKVEIPMRVAEPNFAEFPTLKTIGTAHSQEGTNYVNAKGLDCVRAS